LDLRVQLIEQEKALPTFEVRSSTTMPTSSTVSAMSEPATCVHQFGEKKEMIGR
jgi:hypothetical protein